MLMLFCNIFCPSEVLLKLQDEIKEVKLSYKDNSPSLPCVRLCNKPFPLKLNIYQERGNCITISTMLRFLVDLRQVTGASSMTWF